jgi:Recombination endonuclease VII
MTSRKPSRARGLGVSTEDYERMLAEQGGGCAICGAPPKTRRLHVDHNHKTGKVRGLLCFRCNRALPHYLDSVWISSAYRYVLDAEWREAEESA